MNDPHDPMMPPPAKQFDEHDIWDEKPGMYESWRSPYLLGAVICGAVIWIGLIYVLTRYL